MPLVTNPGALPLETSVAKRSDLSVLVTYKDFAAGIVNTPLVINLFTSLGKYQAIQLSHTELLENFQDTTDAAQVSTSITVGDAGNAARHLAATELNANGAFVPLAVGTGTNYVPAANTVCTLTVTPTAAKNVANLNKGKVLLYFKVVDARLVM